MSRYYADHQKKIEDQMIVTEIDPTGWWQAIRHGFDGGYEDDPRTCDPIGHGKTEREAIIDLLNEEDERRERRIAKAAT